MLLCSRIDCRVASGISAALMIVLGSALAAAPINGGVEAPTPDVFYNFYAPPVAAGNYPGLGAQLYVSPRPVPPRVGHTWNTYPPFMPHEFLYKHHRRYIRPAGVTGMRTVVHAHWW
ncbi:MAG: hypothetical protein DWH98_07635 [Planctomycetota bacterium]|jgi:hypothetical protein|nr:hypothetical protein [Planctomycetia bacterium]RLS62360.1 MAG: hypothetical protein DWH98_07635 [Planctomycetota bacterium]